MNLLRLIELALKSDEVVEFLEAFDLSVVYEFDRLRENTPDCYWASAFQAGFELRFDERQVLDTIFMYVLPRGKFHPIAPPLAGLPFYESPDEAKTMITNRGAPYRESREQPGYVKADFGDYTVHYEFNCEGRLALVTVGARSAASSSGA